LHTSPTLINSIQVDMHWLYWNLLCIVDDKTSW
jgi:hypothetical protein